MTHAMPRLLRSRRTRLVAASSAAAIVWSLAAAAQAQDLPSNPVIVDSNGVGTAADFTFGSNLLTIDQHHDRVVIDWDDFNIGALDTVTFNQPDAGAIAFNRVDPSAFTTIDGTLNANGGVWLFSPGGLLFGSGAVVNVGSFVGTTARLDDGDIADALSTNSVTFSPLVSPNGADLTVSAGADITATSGFVVLLGETIVQNGTIVSDNDAVWFGVVQGGEITFISDGPGSPPELTDGTVAGVAGQQPSITQSNTGSTTAATWVGVSTPSTVGNGWSTLMNLGGTIEASGIKPSTSAGVFIITGDDGVVDLSAVDTTLDTTGGLVTANAGDVYVRTGEAILQDVYASNIDIATGGATTVTGVLQAGTNLLIDAGGDVNISYGAVLDSGQSAGVYANGQLNLDGDVYSIFINLYGALGVIVDYTAYVYGNSIHIDADADIFMDGDLYTNNFIGIYSAAGDVTIGQEASVEAFSINIVADETLVTEAGSLIDNSSGVGTVSLRAYGPDGAGSAMELSGDIDAHNLQLVTAAGSVSVLDGTITLANELNTYVFGDFYTGAPSLIDAAGDVTLNPGGNLVIAGEVRADTLYLDATTIDTGAGYLQPDTALIVDGDDVTLGDVQLSNGLIDVDAVDSIAITGFWATPYSDIYIDTTGAGSQVTLSNGMYASTLTIVSAGDVTLDATADVDVTNYVNTLPGETSASITAYGDLTIVSGAQLDAQENVLLETTGSGSLLTHDGWIRGVDVSFIGSDGIDIGGDITAAGVVDIDGIGDVDLGGQIYGDYVSIVSDANMTQSAGTITAYDGGLYVNAGGDITTEAGASITNGAGADNVVIELFAGNNVYLDGDIHGYEVFVDSVGPMIMIGGSIYASDFIFIYNDTGSLHLTGTADLETGTPVSSAFSSIYLGAYGSVRVDAGAQITAGVGQPGAYVSLYANGPTGYLNMSGDITSGGIYMGARSGDVDVYIGGSLDADEDIFIGATGDLVTGAGSSIIAGDYLWISGDASVDLSGDIYAYQAAVYTDGDFTQGAGTITVDDGGLYVYALNDITTEAGALIETSIDGNQGIIYLNAGHDLYLAGDIDGGYFVTINSVGIGNDTILEVSGSIYATDFIILYNDYGDIHLTGTAELFAGQPTTFGEPGIWIAAEGSILTDAGSYIHTYPGYATGYVHIESNDVTGSIDLSGDITTENLTIEAPFGVVDIFLRGGTITTENDLTIDSNGELLVDATIYADNFYLSAADQLSVGGVLNAYGDVTLNSDTGVAVGGQIFGYDISIGTPGTTDIDGAIYGSTITVGGYDGIYISGTLDSQAEINIISLDGDVAIENGAYIRGYSGSGSAIYIQADGDLTVEDGADLIAYGDLMLVGGTVDFDGYAYGSNFNVHSSGDLDIGANGVVVTPGVIHLLSESLPTVAADITIAGSLTGEDGIYIANRNDGDVVLTSDAEVIAAYFMGLRLGPRGQSSLGGMDGDIYIYSAGSVITDYGSLIDATGGVGTDQGLLTIVSAGTDGPSATPAAIDLSGDIVAWNVDLTASAGSIRQRTGTIEFTEGFTADAAVSFIQDGGGVIDGLVGVDYANVDIYADDSILLLGLIEGYYVEMTTTGTVGGGVIQLAGEVYASDGITISNLDGDILVHSTGVIHTGTPFETGAPDIYIYAGGVITTEAGSQIYTDPAYGAGSTISIISSASSGVGIDLAGDIWTAGEVDIATSGNADIHISGGSVYGGQYVTVDSSDEVEITGGLLQSANTVFVGADSNMLLGGDIIADYIIGAIYDGEQGGFPDLRVEGELTADYDIRLINELGGVEIGATAVVHGNRSGAADVGDPGVSIEGESILTEAGSQILVGADGGPLVGSVHIEAFDYFFGPGPAIDLSGDIGAQLLTFEVGSGNSIRFRDGYIETLSDLTVLADGYIVVDGPASIFSHGDIGFYSSGGMTVDGTLTGDRLYLYDESIFDLQVGGSLYAEEDIRVRSAQDDVRIEQGAVLVADTNNATGPSEFNGISITAAGQVSTDTGTTMRVGPQGAATGDVQISAFGIDGAGYSSIDLSGDIEAQELVLYTEEGSIRLRDGDILLTDDLYVSSPRGFIMDGPATITTPSDVRIYAEYQLSVAGTIDSGDDIVLRSLGAIGGGVTVNGYLYADSDIYIGNSDASAAIVLGGPTLIADADGTSNGSIQIVSAGSVVAPGGGLIQVGDDPSAPTGGVIISADGADAPGTPAMDLSIDINAQTLVLDAPYGSIHLSGGDIFVVQDLEIESAVDFVMDAPATITGQGDVTAIAANNLFVDGEIYAGDDLTLLVGLPGLIQFAPDPGDMVITGSATANGSVVLGNAGGDIYLDGTAYVLANADDIGTSEEVYIYTDGQIVSAAGSMIRVGTGPVASGNVTLYAGGADNVDYSAIDLSGDINAATLTLLTTNGSIALNDGTFHGQLGVQIDSAGGFVAEDGVALTSDQDIVINAQDAITIDGLIDAGLGLFVTRSGSGAADITISGDLYADADLQIINDGPGGDIILNGAHLVSDDDAYGTGDVTITSDGGVYAYNGGLITAGPVNAPTNGVSITAYGTDGAGLSAIDLDTDIVAVTLDLVAPSGSINLAGGDIYVVNPLTVTTPLDFTMADGATIDAQSGVSITANRSMVVDGLIQSGGDVALNVSGPAAQDLEIGGAVYADGDLSVVNLAGDVYLYGAVLAADADGIGGDGALLVQAAGTVTAEGGDLWVGADGGPATGGITVRGGALDLGLDAYGTSIDLDASGSIHLAYGSFVATGDIYAYAGDQITTTASAILDAGADASLIAGTGMDLAGDITAGGDISLEIYSGEGLLTAFVADAGDIVVSSDLTANGAIYISASYNGGDVYLAGTANLLADADNASGDGLIDILADGQVISAAGSTLAVGPSGSPTGDVVIEAFGADNANYSAIDLNSDIEAVNLTIDADAGSVNLAGGAIDVSGDVYVEADYDIIQDQAATIDAGGDVYFGANRALTVEGAIHAGGDVDLLIDAPNSGLLTIDTVVAAGGDIDVVNQGGDVLLGSQAALFSGQDILLSAYGDLTTDGFIDSAAAFTADAGGAMDFQADLQAGAGATFVAGGPMTLDAVIIAEQSSGISAQSGASLYQSGQLIAGGEVQLSAEGDMTVAGAVTALGDVNLLVYGGESGGDILVSGDIVSHDDITIYNQADYGDVHLTGTGSLTADADADGSAYAGVTIYAEGRIIAEAGSTMHVGSPTQRTGLILLGSYAYNGEGGAAIQLAGDIDAEAVEIWADYGSVHVQDGSIQADESIQIYAYEDFIHDDGALIWGAQDRTYQDDISSETILPGLLPGVMITASDVDISGDIQSGTATDDATIVIAALNVDGDVTVGGADNGLGTGFTLSDAEFQNLVANRIVLLAGTGADTPDLIVSDLSIDAANTADVWLGTTGAVFVEGAVTPTQPGEVDLHIGFTVLTQDLDIDLTALSPGQVLVDFIPTDIHISGSLGSVDNPFGHVTLVANGDILMGSSAFMAAAENDPEFDAFEESEEYDSPGEGHVFIAADILQMAATGEILQQDTVEGPGFGGLVLGQPQEGYELIFSPDDIQGQPIGFGQDQWTADFNAGPTRIELFGQFNGTPHAVTGVDTARLDHLLDPDILLGDYEFNTCLFGGTECQTGNEVPPFQNPTPPVHTDPEIIPPFGEDAVGFFSSFPFQEPDEEEEEERIEGEPVTGSGNEDLWPVTSQGGTRP